MEKKYGTPTGRLYRSRGSGYTNRAGYRLLYLPEHPNATATGHVFEHVVVMAEVLGRPLRKGETVHHRNGVKNDNRPENLELWYSGHPGGQRVEDLVQFAHEILVMYGNGGKQ